MARVLVLDVVHVTIPPTKKVKTEEEGEVHCKFAERLDLLKLAREAGLAEHARHVDLA
jgi:hypothetical protein